MEERTDYEKRYMKISEAATLWDLTPRRVQVLCATGKIGGVIRLGRDWMIPRTAVRPADGRKRSSRALLEMADAPLPRKTPFLYMSDLYHTSGTADAVTESLSYHHEARVLFAAEVAYSRGEIDKVYESANYLLNKHSGFYAVISAGMLLALCAIWKGDLAMWRSAKVHISEARAKDEHDREIIALAITAVDSMLYDTQSFPEWFRIGCFEPLTKDFLPAAKVYYAKYLYSAGYALATGTLTIPGVRDSLLWGCSPLPLSL